MYYNYVPLSSSHSPALVAIVFPIKARSQLHSNHLVELARVEAALNWDTMIKLACAHCEHTYAHRRNLTYHMKSKHQYVSVERKVRGDGKKVKTGLDFKCDQFGYLFTERRSLDRHVARNHTDNPAFNCDQCGRSHARSGNLEMHKRTCTGPIVASAPKRRTASAVPEFTVRRKKRALGGTSEMYEVDMKEFDNLTALQAAVTSISTYQRDHFAYKFQMAVGVIFHNAVDPTVITQPAVTLTSEMVAVYGAPPLEDINRQLLNLVEIYKHNWSGWVFSHFASLQLTLWHLDPLRVSAFVPLPQWIRDEKAATNIIGTGDDCFKWTVLAGMHPTMADNRHRMINYVEHACRYDFSSLCFPVSLSSIAPFAAKNNLSINVYGVEEEKKFIFPLCVTDSVVPGSIWIYSFVGVMDISITLQ